MNDPARRGVQQKRICFERKAVIYARVSSKEQEAEGYSIDAQLKLLNQPLVGCIRHKRTMRHTIDVFIGE